MSGGTRIMARSSRFTLATAPSAPKSCPVADPNRKDVNNPDPALRDRPIVGVVIWRHARGNRPPSVERLGL